MNILTLLKAARDEISKAIITITYPHHEVHEGTMFQSSYKSPEGGDVADNGNVDFLISVGARIPHFTFMGAAGGDVEILLFEGTVTSNDGTQIGVHNMNRATGTMTPSTQVFIGPTVTNNGFQIHNSFLPGGSGPHASGGGVRAGTEWPFKTNTKYLLRGTNRSGGATPMSGVVEFYEKGA